MKRKEFIRRALPAFLLLANGKIVKAHDYWLTAERKKQIRLRFAIASDGHYGEEGTDYERYFSAIVSALNREHQRHPLAFTVINGDISHDNKNYLPPAKTALDQLSARYYVSKGNHDKVTPEEWESIWGMPVNLDFTIGKNAFLVGTSSDEKGTYQCPDLRWLGAKLEEHKDRNVFIFIHINPAGMTNNAVNCEELFELFENYKNIKAVFNGHDHDQEGIKVRNNIPFIFDAHFGGSWGTSYHGFRVVEIMKDNSIFTYIMDPDKIINKATL